LEENHEKANALNVFPVPDGDTGTNMLLTMRSAYARIENCEHEAISQVAHDLAHGALMGARGNSGVILSQIWRGLARGLKDKETANAHDIANGLKLASETAYKGVMQPVEGTILTVIREGSQEAVDAAEKSSDLRFLLERVLERSQQALERTPEMLPVLKQAGVVDAGGQGLVFILEGMLQYVNGELVVSRGAQTPRTLPAQALAVPEGGKLENPYDVQFILMGHDLHVETVRRTIDAMGDSTVVVGDSSTIKVHVHVKDPGQPISYGIGLGRITDVVIENMQMQMEEIVSGANAFPRQEPAGPIPANTPAAALAVANPGIRPDQIAVVAVAAGEGLGQILSSLGVASIVNGGQTNNPSTEEILAAIDSLPAERVIVLPNNKNIFLAAEAAGELSAKQVAVVHTRTVPQGVSAMLSWHADGDLEEIAEAMSEASLQVASGEITTSTRSVELNGLSIKEGEIIGLADGNICASGDNISDVLTRTLDTLSIDDREILSVYYGSDVTQEEAQATVEYIETLHPHLEIELLPGGQPFYFYILGAE
jgi:DAK2 domain fusion protein YloV